MARVIEAQNPEAAWMTMSWKSLARVFLIGLAVGLVTYAIFVPLTKLVFEPILCGNESVALVRCGTEASFAAAIAIVLGSMGGLTFLVRERVFRPLLVVLAVALSLWGVLIVVAALPWYLAVVITALAFGLAYSAFSWIAQPSSLTVAMVATTVLVVVARLILTA